MDVLLVEDDAGDVRMIEEAFGEFGIAVRLPAAEIRAQDEPGRGADNS